MSGHGQLRLPASRASAWREGFNTPAYYDDMGTQCGGRHFDKVTPKTCNICGGRPGSKQFLTGSRYATGTITGEYRSGGTIKLRYHATANHKGYFLVKLCPQNTDNPTQSCLDK